MAAEAAPGVRKHQEEGKSKENDETNEQEDEKGKETPGRWAVGSFYCRLPFSSEVTFTARH